MFALSCVVAQVDASEIETVTSWDHYREILVANGKSKLEADNETARMLSSLNNMDRAAGNDRIGIKAPSFRFDGWLNSKPLSLESLRGQVVLVRWWTETCPFCASSAPALREINDEYASRGLTMIGVYHPKAQRHGPLDVDRVKRAVAARELDFPIAIDWNWQTGTLADWWLTGPKRPATSVTFLLDKSGVIQHIHPGMEYHEENGTEGHRMCANDLATIRTEIERLLSEPATEAALALQNGDTPKTFTINRDAHHTHSLPLKEFVRQRQGGSSRRPPTGTKIAPAPAS